MKKEHPHTPFDILRTPLLNKGTAFTQKERDRLGLNGLLPCHISSIDEQLERIHQNFEQKKTPLGKYTFLSSLMNRNEILFYLFAEKYMEEIFPLIYTPTVGEASLQYSLIYKQPRGLYLSYPLKDKVDEMISALPHQDIAIAVITDGERILGLGDQGIGGMAIPVGKLSLYSLFGGIHPSKTLPIILDVGTNNEKLLEHPLYLGHKRKRVEGKEYDAFVERVISALYKRYPNLLLQWEDFGRNNAYRLMHHYRNKILSFNDDIQGTASVALAGILSACRVTDHSIVDKKVVLLGGGSAGLGIAQGIKRAMMEEGLSEKKAAARIYIVDVEGLLYEGLSSIREEQKLFVKSQKEVRDWKGSNELKIISLLDVIANIKPDILIGVSTQGGAFTEETIKEMARHVEHPIIFPLSNPTAKAEAFPEEVIAWTNGKAIIATGSPFAPVRFEGTTYTIGQCNNVYIFPGMGLGATAVGAKRITEGMFTEAAKRLSHSSPMLKDPSEPLFPHLRQIRQSSKEIAIAVGKQAIEEGVAKECDVENAIETIFWTPSYEDFSSASKALS